MGGEICPKMEFNPFPPLTIRHRRVQAKSTTTQAMKMESRRSENWKMDSVPFTDQYTCLEKVE